MLIITRSEGTDRPVRSRWRERSWPPGLQSGSRPVARPGPRGMRSAQRKGRLDPVKYNGDDSGESPLGATDVIDRDGVIRYAFVDADDRKRAEPADVIAALRGLDKTP